MPGIYIHIPYCVQKCPYCDFVSFKSPGISHEEYVKYLLREAELRRHSTTSRVFNTIYIGGGTPSLISSDLVFQIIDTIRAIFPFNWHTTEISIEANPESLSRHWLDEVKAAGVNRLSIGIQSFSDKVLAVLGRPHDSSCAIKALDKALAAEFSCLNIDLMFSIPGQTMQDLEQSLLATLSSGVHHISCYELTAEPGTRLWHNIQSGHTVLPDEEQAVKMMELVEDTLSQNGFVQYEISNFSLPHMECLHNMNYWDNGEYIGLGCSAVSYLNGVRSRNAPSLHSYCSYLSEGKLPVVFSEKLGREAAFRESVMLGLRTLQGISISGMTKRFGTDPVQYYGTRLEKFISSGHMEKTEDRLRLTKQGRRLANSIMSALI